jgi:choline kinase
MRAIILAAGRGLRLQQDEDQHTPKCLLSFGGMSLLERHLRLLRSVGVDEVVLALGFRHELVAAELDRLRWNPRPEIVLYDARIARVLVAGSPPLNRLLIDREFEAGDEPVKVCVQQGIPIELRKQLPEGLQYEIIGESIGFFRLGIDAARRLAALTAAYAQAGRGDQPHEEAVRDLLLERSHRFEVADVTGAPWIEIDFPNDVTRAAREVLPQLQP